MEEIHRHLEYIAEGGKVANSSGNNAYSGGDGGSGGAVFANQIGSEDGNNGSNYGSYYGGFGQGYSTKEFGEVGQTMYSGGGSSGSGACNSSGGGCSSHISGYRNTGGGGSGGNDYISTGSGGSGVVVIRNSRVVKINNQDYFIYDGTYEVIEESNENWKVMFYSSGTLIPRKNMNIDIFLVGGGAGGKTDNSPIGAGGGGGYTLTKKSINLYTGQEYNIIIGSGGKIGINGGNTSAFGYVAEGGKAANSSGNNVYSGGDGGSGGAVFANQIGGEDGNNGLNNGSYYGGFGQGYSTREFGEVGQTMYSGGGSSGSGACNSSGGGCSSHTNGYRNTGGGGCGGTNIVSSGVGGSGIVVIRNSRTIKFSNQDYFVYDGTYEVIEEYDNNWRIKFYSSGTLIPRKNMNIDVFLVGGGAGGKIDDSPNGAGGGGGYTYTKTSITLTAGEPYYLIVGQGGKINEDGGETSAFGYTTPGGKYLNSRGTSVLFGGDGGSGGGCFSLQGGENGTSGGTSGTYYGGSGQGTTTREFGELSGTIYSGGGSPHSVSPTASGGGGRGRPNGLRNSGGGGAGGTNVSNAGVGGSGIIVIRNERN